MAGLKVLVIEDEADIQEVMAYNLKREGFAVVASGDGAEGLELARQVNPGLVLLDLMLPGLDGLELCRRLRQDPITRAIPIIMVTAKGEESDVVIGLSVGADDYIIKPFSPRELLARVRAVLRRGAIPEQGTGLERLVRGGVVIDATKHRVEVDGTAVMFTATEFRLLHFLASHPGRVFSRNQLLNRIISDDAVVIDRNIDVHIRAIRKKLGKHRGLIETQRGVGYRFHEADG
jgi:two-component system phosphate regulon response regulator PhoB